MPQQITHPFDKDHVLSLFPKPLYQEGFFYCDACGKQGEGFCYHCKICKIDLHILCAAMQLNLTHQSHCHELKLVFSLPHVNGIFNCHICNTTGSNYWFYRCHLCDFDVHLNCKNGPAPVNPLMQGICNSFLQRQQNDQLLLQILQASLGNSPQNSHNQQYLQALLAGGGESLGGGAGGLGGAGGGLGGMQLYLGTGNYGGGGIPGLNLSGNGGGWQDTLQTLLAGDAEGLNILQGLMGVFGNGLDVLGDDDDLSMLNDLDLGGFFGG